jgi:D-aspartate ligase
MNFFRNAPGALILGGSFISLAAARNLAKNGVEVCVFGSATSIARFSRTVKRFAVCPRDLKDDDLPGYLAEMADKGEVKGWVLLPSTDEYVRVLAQYGSFLAEHYVVTTPPWETVSFLCDKRRTYELAQQVGAAIPRLYAVGDTERLDRLDMDFPVVVKPAFSSKYLRVTNRKAYRADNRKELQTICAAMSRVIGDSQIIVQDFLPDPGANLFSFAGYFKKGDPVVGLSAKRTRQLPRDFGHSSTFVEAVEVPELRELASRLLRAISYTGLAEVEFMWNVKRARFELIEVNPRLWAWHSLAIAAGLDLPYVAFADAVCQNLPVSTMRPGLKWVRLLKDVRAIVPEIRSGSLSAFQYVRSLLESTTFSVFSVSDPVPFIVEPFLLLLERLNRVVARRTRRIGVRYTFK